MHLLSSLRVYIIFILFSKIDCAHLFTWFYFIASSVILSVTSCLVGVWVFTLVCCLLLSSPIILRMINNNYIFMCTYFIYLWLFFFLLSSPVQVVRVEMECWASLTNLFLPRELFLVRAQSAGAVKYTDYISAVRSDPSPNESPGYGTKQSDGEATVMLELWNVQSTPSLSSFPCQLWSGVVAPEGALSMGQIKLSANKWHA